MKKSMAIRRATYGRAFRDKRSKTLSIEVAESFLPATDQIYCAAPHLEGLDESPKQGADALPSAEELDQPHDPKQTEEGDGDASTVLCVLWRGSPESEENEQQCM